jgi:hypothetical protein
MTAAKVTDETRRLHKHALFSSPFCVPMSEMAMFVRRAKPA